MADYQKYINDLRKCAEEHANDTASMGHIIVSALLTDTANLLVRVEKIPKYILALRKCAEEHANDKTSTGNIIVSDLCRDTANLLEGLEQEPCKDMGEVSDGYHTFNQLYHQRAVLFATIVNLNKDKAWKSFKHSDGKYCFDSNGEWFIVGVDTPKGSYTYHYSKEYWDMFHCEELECGKEWDGHTEEDVTRLLSLTQDLILDKIKSEVLKFIDDLDIASEICDIFDKYKVTQKTKMKYRKKPVVVEAYQTDSPMMIHTPEGDMTAYVGDYIITGVNGEQYPCKPDIFEKTYERVNEGNMNE